MITSSLHTIVSTCSSDSDSPLTNFDSQTHTLHATPVFFIKPVFNSWTCSFQHIFAFASTASSLTRRPLKHHRSWISPGLSTTVLPVTGRLLVEHTAHSPAALPTLRHLPTGLVRRHRPIHPPPPPLLHPQLRLNVAPASISPQLSISPTTKRPRPCLRPLNPPHSPPTFPPISPSNPPRKACRRPPPTPPSTLTPATHHNINYPNRSTTNCEPIRILSTLHATGGAGLGLELDDNPHYMIHF